MAKICCETFEFCNKRAAHSHPFGPDFDRRSGRTPQSDFGNRMPTRRANSRSASVSTVFLIGGDVGHTGLGVATGFFGLPSLGGSSPQLHALYEPSTDAPVLLLLRRSQPATLAEQA